MAHQVIIVGSGWTNQVKATAEGELKVLTQSDVFGRTKTAHPFAISDNIIRYDKKPFFWDTIALGSAETVHLTNESAVNLVCGSASGDSVIISQRKHNIYQAGRSLSIVMTGAVGSIMNGTIRRWGYFDKDDGLFFELSGNALAVVRRTSTDGTVVNNRIEQSNWNKDTLNGSGVSRFNLDVTKNNIYGIEFQWLSAVRVSFSVDVDEIDIGKKTLHVMENSNTFSGPYMKTANLPLRYEQEVVDDGSEQSTYKAICSSVSVLGGESPEMTVFTGGLLVEQGITTTEEHLYSIKLSGTFNGIVNRSQLLPQIISAASELKQSTFRILLNSNISGTFSAVDPINSSAEIIIGSRTFGGGIPLLSFTVGKDGQMTETITSLSNPESISLSLNASGNSSDKLTVAARSSNANANVISSLTWGERR